METDDNTLPFDENLPKNREYGRWIISEVINVIY